jgi:hypothetical protein
MTKPLSIILTFIVWFIQPCYAQRLVPQFATTAPPAIKFFRVAITPKVSFQSEALAKYASQELNKQFPDDAYKFIIKHTGNTYQVSFLIKIIFFDKNQAVAAMNFLKENPAYDNTKYDITVATDDSY